MKKDPITAEEVKAVMKEHNCNLNEAIDIMSEGKWNYTIVRYFVENAKRKQRAYVTSNDCCDPQLISWRFHDGMTTIYTPCRLLQNLVEKAANDKDASIFCPGIIVPDSFYKLTTRRLTATGSLVYAPNMPGKCVVIPD